MELKKIIYLCLGLFGISGLLHLLAMNGTPIHPLALLSSRWVAIAVLFYIGIKKNSFTLWIFISMLVGAEIGLYFGKDASGLKAITDIFIRMIKTIIAPLIISTLVVGIAGHSNIKQVGRMGWKSLVYFELVTTIALVVGLAAINFSQAGKGLQALPTEMLEKNQAEIEKKTTSGKAKTGVDHVVDSFPENIGKAVVENNILQIVVFAVIFGIALAMVHGSKKQMMLEWMESLAEIMFKFTDIVMLLSPFAVGASIAYAVGNLGLDIFRNLALLVLTLMVALVIFVLCVLLPIALLIKLPIKKFIEAVKEPVSIAFSTASSEAALPKALENMEKFGVPQKIVAFVLPTGYSFNLDGTTLYLSLASVFVAQAAGIDLSLGQQIAMMLTLMLTSKGVAGVRSAGLVILLSTATSFDLPLWPIATIYAIDFIMDMARTSVNMLGNCLATCVIARWEGELHVKE